MKTQVVCLGRDCFFECRVKLESNKIPQLSQKSPPCHSRCDMCIWLECHIDWTSLFLMGWRCSGNRKLKSLKLLVPPPSMSPHVRDKSNQPVGQTPHPLASLGHLPCLSGSLNPSPCICTTAVQAYGWIQSWFGTLAQIFYVMVFGCFQKWVYECLHCWRTESLIIPR